MAYLFCVGLISILGQVVLLRELNVAFYGVELIYTLALGVWLLFSACGALIGRRIQNPSSFRIGFLFLLLFFCIPLDVAFIRSIRLLFSGVPGAYLPLSTQIIAMSIALLPVGLLLGLLFQWAAQAYMGSEKSLAAAYAIESLGGLAGGVCGALFLKYGFQNFAVAMICAFFALGSSFLKVKVKQSRWVYAAMAAVIGSGAILLWKTPELDRFLTARTHPNLLETRDTPYSRITIASSAGQVSVFENDAFVFDTEGTIAEEFVHLAALQHPNPRRILVLGGGIEGIVREALQHAPTTVDYVELNPSILKIVPRHLPREIRESLKAASVRIFCVDPRQFLNTASNYDLILVGMPEPSSGQANRFYTREFFQHCRKRLTPGGVLAFRLQSSEYSWTRQLTRRMISIYRAAKSAFPEVSFIPGSTNVVICTTGSLIADPSVLSARLDARAIRTKLISSHYLRYQYTNDRFMEVAEILRSGSAPINTDIRPICYQYTIMLWVSKFIPAMNFHNFPLFEPSLIESIVWFSIIILLALWLHFVRWSIRRVILTGAAAFAGMVLETSILLHFQTKNGVLYQDIGILLTTFMAGLALGSMSVAKATRFISRKYGVALLLGFALFNATVGWAINSGRSAGLLETSGMLILAGFFVAAVFAYASLYAANTQRDVIAPLYSADLIGGCLGSLLASLLLAPLAGLGLSAYLMAPLALLSIILLL